VSLAKDDFSSCVSRSVQNLFKDNEFTDVTLVCELNQQIKAHKVILSSSSTFFRGILTVNRHHHPLIYLKGVKHKKLKQIIEFVYLGEINIEKSEVNAFVELGKDLKIDGLFEEDAEKVHENSSPPTPRGFHSINERPVDDIVDNEFSFYSLEEKANDSLDSEDEFLQNNENETLVSPTSTLKEEKQGCEEIDELMKIYQKKEVSAVELVSCQINYEDSILGSPLRKKIKLEQGLGGRQRTKELMEIYKKKDVELEDDLKPFACTKCDFASEHQGGFKKHILSKHEGMRYQCEQCEKSYSDSCALLRHKKSVHDGVVHKCDVCEKNFSEAGAVTRHKKKFHTSAN